MGAILRHSQKGPSAAAAALLTLLVFWAPLPFGSAGPVTGWALRLGVCLVVVLSAIGVRSLRGLHHLRLALWGSIGLAALAFLQSVPLPFAVVEMLSPVHGRLFAQAGELLGEPVRAALSLAPSASRGAAIGWAFVALYAMAGALVGRRRGPRRWLGGALLFAALFQVFYGASGWLSGETTIWGVQAPATDQRLRGTFVNSDHLATYLQLAQAVTFAWGWWGLRRSRWEVSAERRLALVAPPILAGLTLFGGLVATGSRAGLVGAVLGLAAQGVLLAVAGRRLRWAPVGLGVGALALGAVILLGVGQGLGRFQATTAYELLTGARAQAYQACWELWLRFPIFGSGAGTFREAFTLAQPSTLPGTWLHAHSDPLELLVTQGLIGALLLGLVLFGLVRRLLRVLNLGERSEDRAAALAALGALVSSAVHELFDFGLTVSANTLTIALLLAVAAAARTRPADS